MVTETIGALGRARTAVTVAFLLHGLVGAAWVARIPQIKRDLGLSEGSLGLALLGAPVGVVLAVRFAGWTVARWGSRATTLGAGAVAALSLAPLGLAWNLGALTCALVLMGGSLGLMDVAMNAQGVAVERRYGRPLMSGLHGAYSVGTLGAALVGSAAAHLDVPAAVHLSLAGVVLAAALLLFCRGLLDRSADVMPDPEAERAAESGDGPGDELDAGAGPESDPGPGSGARTDARVRSGATVAAAVRAGRWTLALLGVIGLCSFVGEGAMADWSAVYLRETLETGAGVAGLGYAGCAVAMAVGRLAGDRIVARFGPVPVLRAGALIAALGLGLGLAAGHPAAAVLGFTLFGLGVAPVAPVTFSAAGNLPGVPAAHGIARVTAVGYLGLLGGPPVIGFVAQGVGLGWALAVPVALVALIVPLAGATSTAGR
ncbi:MFS transporter [Actinomadura rugatobispora]|uniref:MFS transporter n=1 Tax=Actinomadura rugatobispora TaxID=1994 RepID=A0ABW1A5X3_9ACTN